MIAEIIANITTYVVASIVPLIYSYGYLSKKHKEVKCRRHRKTPS